MKRVLISAVAAGALLGQLNAFEVYKNGDKSFGVFGSARALLGYGLNITNGMYDGKITKNSTKTNGEFLAGIQGNSRIGINFTVGKVFGAALIGVGESTLYGAGGNTGFRQLYAGYDFGDAGKLLAGKVELITSMGGFSSDTWNTDDGLNGFGGKGQSTRRLQIAYSVAGLTFSISENDFGGRTGGRAITSGNTTTVQGRGYEVPRFSLGYEYKDSDIRAKVAASYAYKNDTAADTAKNAFLVTAGIRPTFGDSYVAALLTYGYNAEKLGEINIATPKLSAGFQNVGVTSKPVRGTNNTNIAALALEYGMNLTNDLALKIGAGYQYAHNQGDSADIHSYAGFVQLPYKVGAGFNIIPQVGYMGTTEATKATGKWGVVNTGNFLATVQFSLNF